MEMLFEEEQRKIQTISDRLQRDSNSIAVLVINKDGQEIARSGQTKDLDITSLSSLFAGNVAATSAIAKLLKEEEFGGQFHEGTKYNVNISVVAKCCSTQTRRSASSGFASVVPPRRWPRSLKNWSTKSSSSRRARAEVTVPISRARSPTTTSTSCSESNRAPQWVPTAGLRV